MASFFVPSLYYFLCITVLLKAQSEKIRMKNAHYGFLAVTLVSYILLYGIIALLS